jgi:PAS domain S-box-containing protein
MSEPERQTIRAIVDGVKDYAIFVIDPNGVILTWNEGARIIKGYDPDEVIGTSFSRFYTPEDLADGKPARLLATAAREGRVEDEGWRVRKDGTRIWADVVLTALRGDDGSLQGFVKVTRDLTGRRRVEEELAARARQQSAVAALGLHALRTSSLEDLVEHALESVRETLGTDVADLIVAEDGALVRRGSVGWSEGPPPHEALGIVQLALERSERIVVADILTETRFRPNPQAVALGLRSGAAAVLHGALPESGPLGVIATYSKTLRTFVDEDLDFINAVANVVATAFARAQLLEQQNAAERAAAEERVRASRAQAEVRERDEFISIAAHELRTPLTALHLKLDSARHGLGAPTLDVKKLSARLEGAMRQADRLTGLVERLLDVSRIVAGRFELRRETVDLAALAARVVEDVREQAQRAGCPLTLEAREPIAAECDPARIEQVIANLLSNAIKYGGGKPIHVVVERNGDMAAISVTDDGIGIAPEDVERIFGRFERAATSAYGGLGLGLYISRRILEAHGGHIRVESLPGRGAKFIAELPEKR